jgi:acetyl-CoA acyltransferase
MAEAFICDAVRTPIGRYGGVLSGVRTDDLAAIPIKTLIERNASIDWSRIDDVIFGCANQAGEDNRNVARMAALLAGLPVDVSGVTVNRLCGSGMEAVVQAARAVKTGEANLVIAGGVECMSRAPFVVRDAQGDERFFPQCGDLRHDHRMAFCQSAYEEGLRRRIDARDL